MYVYIIYIYTVCIGSSDMVGTYIICNIMYNGVRVCRSAAQNAHNIIIIITLYDIFCVGVDRETRSRQTKKKHAKISRIVFISEILCCPYI